MHGTDVVTWPMCNSEPVRRIRGKRLLLVAVLTLALAGGAAAALAATGGHSGRAHARHAHAAGARHTLLAAAAAYLGLSTQQLSQDLRSGKSLGEVATAQGRSQSGLIEALVAVRKARLSRAEANVEQRVTALVERHGRFARRRGELLAAAAYLKLTPAQVEQRLGSGETLAQLAAATPGASVAGLTQALLARREQQLTRALASGRLSPQQQSARAARLAERVKALIERRLPAPSR